MKFHVYATALGLMTLGIAAPVFAADLPEVEPPAPAASSGIRVLSAQYGDASSGRLCNAAGPIAALCDGHGQCTFDVRNIGLCGDPSFLVIKQLNVTYTCGVGEYRTRISEYGNAVLACQQP